MKKLLPFVCLVALAACREHSRGSERVALGQAQFPEPIAAQVEPSPAGADFDEGMEEEVEERADERRAWIENRHHAAPGVDWRAIERANGEAEMARRNALAKSGQLAAVNTWSEVGSKNQAGRMWCATLASDGVSLYSGSDLGGLWKGDLNGSSWAPLGDNLYGGVYDVASIPGEFGGQPDVVLVVGASNTIRVTRDEGATWETPTGLTNVSEIRGVGRFLDAAHTLLVLVKPNAGGAPALYASTDYGRTFTKRYQHATSGAASFWIPRRGAGSLASVYLFVKGACFVSTNGGSTFAPLGVADSGATDCVLTGSEAGSPTLYVALANGGTWKLWRSDDGGASFTNPFTIGGFYGTLCASSFAPNIVMWGDIEAHRSTNSGASFASINTWGSYYGSPSNKLHADLFGFDVFVDPANPTNDLWFFGTDGGLYKSTNFGATVQNLCLSGLGVSQYYSTLTSKATPTLIQAGAQDQGYQRGSFVASTGAGPSSNFAQLISGDYGHLTSSDGSHARVVSTYPGFILLVEGENSANTSTLNFPSGASNDWLPPVVADPGDNKVFYFLGNQLWKYTRQTNGSWTTTLQSNQNFAIGGSFLTALAFAPSDSNRVYAVNDGGRIWFSTDHGVTWTQSASTAPGQQYFYGNGISVHPTNALECAIGGSGYSTSGVIRSTNGGATFAPENNGLPQTHVYSLAYATDGTGDLYAGAQQSALRWHRATATWETISSLGSPITTYWSVEIVDAGATARFGTYGRGIWDFEIQPVPSFIAYGTGKTNSFSTQPFLASTGTPSLSANDFSINVFGGVSNKPGSLIYSASQAQLPFQGGTLWIGLPIKRGPNMKFDAFGTDYIPVPVDATMVGITRYYQVWYRDPQHPDGTGVGLSNGGKTFFGP
ncbi:MAG: hypothetical protein K8S98_01480 [Planctomycetes bacterium]|nr:hypothetical protein [Planctomycetota bacterium]